MPMIPLEVIFRTITEQDTQIKMLKQQIAQLEAMLENQNQENLTQELKMLVTEYPEKLQNPIIASTDLHWYYYEVIILSRN